MRKRRASKLTPELAEAIVDLRAENKGYVAICQALRKAPHNVSLAPSVISYWIAEKREIEIDGEPRSFADMMRAAADVNAVEDSLEIVKIADEARKKKEPPGVTKHRINSRVWRWKMMNPTHVHHSGEIEAGGKVIVVLPDSPMFDEEGEP